MKLSRSVVPVVVVLLVTACGGPSAGQQVKPGGLDPQVLNDSIFVWPNHGHLVPYR